MPGARNATCSVLGLLSLSPLAAVVQFAILYARIAHAVNILGPEPAGLDGASAATGR